MSHITSQLGVHNLATWGSTDWNEKEAAWRSRLLRDTPEFTVRKMLPQGALRLAVTSLVRSASSVETRETTSSLDSLDGSNFFLWKSNKPVILWHAWVCG